MSDDIVTIERAGVHDELVLFNLGFGAELPVSFSKVEESFHDCLKNRDVQIIVNMSNVKLPPAKFIALLVETSCQARRMGGDIKLINIAPSVRNNLVTFSALTYLSIEESEQHALYDFNQKLVPSTFDLTKGLRKVSPKADESILTPKHTAVPVQKISLDSQMIAEDQIKVQSQTDSLYLICDFVTGYAEKAGFDIREIGKIKVTAYEACLNVIEHAYFSNPDNWIEVSVRYNDQKFYIIIDDWGQGFEFHPANEYDVKMAVKDRKTGGFGLHIIQRTVDEIQYEADAQNGNRLILVKYLVKHH